MHTNLKDVITLFARLGITAFGGPAAHIAMMRHEVVKNRRWMDDACFLDLVGATSLIPGPNSTEMAIHLGKERAGARGLIAAGLLFILPAVIITGIIAWLYKEYGTLPEAEPFLYGIKPAVIAVILVAVYPLAKTAVKNKGLAVTGVAALVMALAGLPEILVMFGLGVLYVAYNRLLVSGKMNSFFLLMAVPVKSISNYTLFFTFLKIGSVLYGSGYVLFAFIDSELVAEGLLSRSVLTDAIAIGQFTPGPVFSSVTFIGYQLNGLTGAMAATAGVFLPSFAFVALLSYMLRYLKTSMVFKQFLDAVNIAAVAVIAAVCWEMARESITDWRTVIIACASFLLLLVFPRINSAVIIVLGAVSGYLLFLL